jgi:structure-specific recognition protein 1
LYFYREELTEKYKSKLSSEMNGPIHEVMSRLVKAVTARKITIPGTFKRYLLFFWEKSYF